MVPNRQTTAPETPGDDTRPRKKPTVLLVEDNEDFRFYLKDNLRAHYHITEAANGKEGVEKGPGFTARPGR